MNQIFELLNRGFEVRFRRDSELNTFRVTLSKQTQYMEVVQASFRFTHLYVTQTFLNILELEISELEKQINKEIHKREIEIRSSENPS